MQKPMLDGNVVGGIVPERFWWRRPEFLSKVKLPVKLDVEFLSEEDVIIGPGWSTAGGGNWGKTIKSK